jgi:hypothetical protein
MSKRKKHLRVFRCLTFVVIVWLTVIFWVGGGNPLAADANLSIRNVRLDRNVLRSGESANLSFHLSRDARVTILIYGPNYEMVRSLMDQQPRAAGVNGVAWDGRDDSGRAVPDEAYLVSILAEGPGGERAVYDPTSVSGGEAFDIQPQRIKESSGTFKIHYSVPFPARINIRAGVHNGPLLKTILDWKPMPAGDQVQAWNGMDETGRIRAIREPGRILHIKGFRLPENTIIVRGNSENYASYYRAYRRTPSDRANVLSFQSAKDNALKRMEKGVSQQYLIRQSLNTAPSFTVYLGQDRTSGLAERGVVIVSGQIVLTMEVSPDSLDVFNESRYEIVVFVDQRRFDEEEQAYSSHSYLLDTRQFVNGEHLITINLASMTGQVGSYSFRIDVRN